MGAQAAFAADRDLSNPLPRGPNPSLLPVVDAASAPDVVAVNGPDRTHADRPPEPPPQVTATWLRRLEAGLRVGLALCWLAASRVWSAESFATSTGLASGALGLAALSLLAARLPRAAGLAAWGSAAVLYLSVELPVGAGAVALGSAASAGLVALHSSAAGAWLREVWHWERQRRLACLATGIAAGSEATALAGDLYEYEGLARRELGARGAVPARWVGWLGTAAETPTRWACHLPALKTVSLWLATRLRSRLQGSLG